MREVFPGENGHHANLDKFKRELTGGNFQLLNNKILKQNMTNNMGK